jgi:hypothetical protein
MVGATTTARVQEASGMVGHAEDTAINAAARRGDFRGCKRGK